LGDNIIDTTGNDTTIIIDTTQPCSPDTVYFQNTILPIFQSNCALSGCHNATSHKEGLILDTYNNIINTGNIQAFSPNHGKIYESITETNPNDVMPPPPQQPLSSQQINLIYTWIMQGALNNHCDECDTTTMSYALNIVPILQSSCYSCHSGSAPIGGFVLNNYSAVLAKVQNGKLLGSIKHQTGFAGMPSSYTSLSACNISKIESWINSGALNN